MAKHVYIDLNPLLNTEAIIKEAFTERGDGKTTGLVKTAWNSRFDSGKTAVLCRRFATEMGTSYLDDILNKVKTYCDPSKTQNLRYTGSYKRGGIYLIDKDNKDDFRPIFHLFPLTMAGRMKSGLDYATHKNLYIDEYIPLDQRYIKDEAIAILELYRTIDRDHFDNYVLICGNLLVSTKAPATDKFFGIDRPYDKNALTLHKGNSIAILTHKNKGNVATLKQSKFGSLIAGTTYQNYAEGGTLDTTYTPPIIERMPKGKHTDIYVTDGIDTLCASIYQTCLLFSKVGLKEAKEACERNRAPLFTTDKTQGKDFIYIKEAANLAKVLRLHFIHGTFYFTDTKTAFDILNIAVTLSKL